jgi:hypothetical protein
MKSLRSLLALGLCIFTCNAFAQEDFYSIGSVSVTDYFVDPSSGNDSNNGLSRTSPKRTVSSIWNAIPQGSSLSTGYRINLLPGTYTTDHLPNYWENRQGTATAPIILQSADGFGTVNLRRDINMANVSYFYLLGVEIKNQLTDGFGDSFHGESCNHILLRGNSLNGAPNGLENAGDIAHETIKFNQSQHIYIENNDIQGAGDNAIDWVSVHYGHIKANKIHNTQGWCLYAKGGSSYISIDGNFVYDCGEGGMTAGQGTGFEFMDSPWLRYEANYIKMTNNVVRDVVGAAFGVNGGFNILIAHNVAYRVGSRSHLVEFVYGLRSCDGNTSACAARRALGGWGPAQVGDSFVQPIGNNNVIFANNIIYNPAGFISGQHFTIQGPRTPTVSGIPSPQRTDTGLRIFSNIIWNGNSGTPVGIEDDSEGCRNSNPTCNLAQINSDNTINSLLPDFRNTSASDFRPSPSSALAAVVGTALPDFDALDTSLNPIPEGERTNLVSKDFSGGARTTVVPGPYSGPDAGTNFSDGGSGGTPTDSGGTPGDTDAKPKLSKAKYAAKKSGGRVTLTASAVATDDRRVSSVKAEVRSGTKVVARFSLALRSGKYTGTKTITSSARSLTFKLTATDSGRQTATASKTVTVK